MTKKCIGCGAVFQTEYQNEEGYVAPENFDDAIVCKRCFRIKNYGDYQIINKDKSVYEKVFNGVKKEKDLVLFLCDILNIDEDIKKIDGFSGPVILVITKIDLLPKSVKERKLKQYINSKYKLNVVDIIFISSVKKHHIDELMNIIKKHKTSVNVYVVGNTNAGKSTLINTLIKSFSDNDSFVTASILPQTTMDLLNVKLNDDITLIDTPGIVDDDNYLYKKDKNIIKEVTPKKEIKPRTYQIKPNQSIIIGSYARLDYLSETKNSITIYLSNDIKVTRINLNTNDYLKNLCKTSFKLSNNKDVVISGLCFCKITKKCNLEVFTDKNVKVYERDNLI